MRPGTLLIAFLLFGNVLKSQTMYYFEISAPETGKPIVVFLPVVSNPANDEVLLSWELKRKARITLSVSDAMGRLTVTNPLGELQAGIWTNSVPTAALSNGVYYAVLYAGKQRIVQQFIVQH